MRYILLTRVAMFTVFVRPGIVMVIVIRLNVAVWATTLITPRPPKTEVMLVFEFGLAAVVVRRVHAAFSAIVNVNPLPSPARAYRHLLAMSRSGLAAGSVAALLVSKPFRFPRF